MQMIDPVTRPVAVSRASRGFLARISLLWLAFVPLSAPAQLTIEITGVGSQTYPVLIRDFNGPRRLAAEIASILREDLESAGAFRLIQVAGRTEAPVGAQLPWEDWKAAGADAVIAADIGHAGDRVVVKAMLLDVQHTRPMEGIEVVGSGNAAASAAHRLADWIYQSLTGVRGVFSTRIAYVAKRDGRYELHVTDATGQRGVVALASWHPILSPAWSPDGSRIAYVSLESKKPVVYVHDVGSGRREVLANFRGSNSAPAWSPDGRHLAVVLTKDGTSRLYLITPGGRIVRPLADSVSIDTEPRFSPDGRHVYFTSDRGGSPQIYRVGTEGGDVERITFEGAYNTTPRISPDGRWIAYVSKHEDSFRLAIIDMATRQVQYLASSEEIESPTIAPNGRLIAYTIRVGEKSFLEFTTPDGNFRRRIAIEEGALREPAWGPFPH